MTSPVVTLSPVFLRPCAGARVGQVPVGRVRGGWLRRGPAVPVLLPVHGGPVEAHRLLGRRRRRRRLSVSSFLRGHPRPTLASFIVWKCRFRVQRVIWYGLSYRGLSKRILSESPHDSSACHCSTRKIHGLLVDYERHFLIQFLHEQDS